MKNSIKLITVLMVAGMLCGCNITTQNTNESRPEVGRHSDSFKELEVSKDTSSDEPSTESTDSTTSGTESKEPVVNTDLSDISKYTDYKLGTASDGQSVDFSSTEVEEGLMNRIMEFGFNRGAGLVRQAIIEICDVVGIDIRELYLMDNGVEYDTDYIYNIICMENKEKVLAVAVDVKSNSVKYLCIDKKG